MFVYPLDAMWIVFVSLRLLLLSAPTLPGLLDKPNRLLLGG
jgi:hypothetical protein